MSNTYAITASSLEYRLYSALAPSVIEEVFSFGFQYCRGCFLITTLNPINPFYAELLTAACIVLPGAVCESTITLILVYIYIS
jgi:hypothetical protein